MGQIGKKHAHLLKATENASLVGVADMDLEKAEEAQHQLEIPFFENWQTFLDAGLPIDVINICTPNGHHYEQALYALEKGYDVLVEKPVTLRVKECRDLLEKAEEVGKNVFCVLQNRYSPTAKWLKAVVEKGRLGSVYMVEINCYWNRGRQYYENSQWRGNLELDGGTLFTQFSHFVDLLVWVFGPAKTVQGDFYNFNHQGQIDFEDSGVVRMELSCGAKGVMTYSTAVWDQNMESSITVIGEKGSLKIAGQYMDRVAYCHIQDYEVPDLPQSNPPNDYGHFKGSAANHAHVFADVIRVLNGEHLSLPDASEACQSIALIEKAYAER